MTVKSQPANKGIDKSAKEFEVGPKRGQTLIRDFPLNSFPLQSLLF